MIYTTFTKDLIGQWHITLFSQWILRLSIYMPFVCSFMWLLNLHYRTNPFSHFSYTKTFCSVWQVWILFSRFMNLLLVLSESLQVIGFNDSPDCSDLNILCFFLSLISSTSLSSFSIFISKSLRALSFSWHRHFQIDIDIFKFIMANALTKYNFFIHRLSQTRPD